MYSLNYKPECQHNQSQGFQYFRYRDRNSQDQFGYGDDGQNSEQYNEKYEQSQCYSQKGYQSSQHSYHSHSQEVDIDFQSESSESCQPGSHNTKQVKSFQQQQQSIFQHQSEQQQQKTNSISCLLSYQYQNTRQQSRTQQEQYQNQCRQNSSQQYWNNRQQQQQSQQQGHYYHCNLNSYQNYNGTRRQSEFQSLSNGQSFCSDLQRQNQQRTQNWNQQWKGQSQQDSQSSYFGNSNDFDGRFSSYQDDFVLIISSVSDNQQYTPQSQYVPQNELLSFSSFQNQYDQLINDLYTDSTIIGLSICQIEQFPIMKWTKNHKKFDSSQQCSFCLQNYCVGNKLRVLSCMHRFHQQCIDEWLIKKSSCPLCKIPLR